VHLPGGMSAAVKEPATERSESAASAERCGNETTDGMLTLREVLRAREGLPAKERNNARALLAQCHAAAHGQACTRDMCAAAAPPSCALKAWQNATRELPKHADRLRKAKDVDAVSIEMEATPFAFDFERMAPPALPQSAVKRERDEAVPPAALLSPSARATAAGAAPSPENPPVASVSISTVTTDRGASVIAWSARAIDSTATAAIIDWPIGRLVEPSAARCRCACSYVDALAFMFVNPEGRVHIWGSNACNGELGCGDEVLDLATPTCLPLPSRVVSVSSGGNHTLLLTEEGDVFTFGYPFGSSFFGDDVHDVSFVPSRIAGALCGLTVRAVSASEEHSLLLTENGQVFSFGSGEGGCLGHGDQEARASPTPIEALRGVCACSVAAGCSAEGSQVHDGVECLRSNHSLVLCREGRVYSFGDGSRGVLGHGLPYRLQLEPKVVPFRHLGGWRARAIATGSAGSLVIVETGEVFRLSGYRALTFMDSFDVHESKYVALTIPANRILPQPRAVQISVGGTHSLVLTEDGSVFSFGHSNDGALGHGQERRSCAHPTRIVGLCGMHDLSAGHECSVALGSDGSVFAWGYVTLVPGALPRDMDMRNWPSMHGIRKECLRFRPTRIEHEHGSM